MPPAAGIGIGIDRLVMLFPHMRPVVEEEGEKRGKGEAENVPPVNPD